MLQSKQNQKWLQVQFSPSHRNYLKLHQFTEAFSISFRLYILRWAGKDLVSELFNPQNPSFRSDNPETWEPGFVSADISAEHLPSVCVSETRSVLLVIPQKPPARLRWICCSLLRPSAFSPPPSLPSSLDFLRCSVVSLQRFKSGLVSLLDTQTEKESDSEWFYTLNTGLLDRVWLFIFRFLCFGFFSLSAQNFKCCAAGVFAHVDTWRFNKLQIQFPQARTRSGRRVSQLLLEFLHNLTPAAVWRRRRSFTNTKPDGAERSPQPVCDKAELIRG